ESESEEASVASSIQWDDEWTLQKLSVLPPRLTFTEIDLDLGHFTGLDLDVVEKLPIKNLRILLTKLQKLNILKPRGGDEIERSFQPCWIKDMQYPQRR